MKKPSPQRAYQIARKERGMCIICPCAWAYRSDRCREHYERDMEQRRERYRRSKGGATWSRG